MAVERIAEVPNKRIARGQCVIQHGARVLHWKKLRPSGCLKLFLDEERSMVGRLRVGDVLVLAFDSACARCYILGEVAQLLQVREEFSLSRLGDEFLVQLKEFGQWRRLAMPRVHT